MKLYHFLIHSKKLKSGFVWFSLLFILFSKSLSAQFVDITQTEPFANPASVCQGGTLTFRLNNLQNLNPGSIITMEISNLGIGFNWTSCTTLAWSTDNINYTPGNYVWNGNIANSYIRVQIPVGAPVSTGYTARATSSNPNITGGNNNGSINVTAAYATVPQIAQNTYGNNVWNGHHYTWTPTVPSGTLLNTPALVSAQSFFVPANYIGHSVQNVLSFDNNYAAGGIPGNFFDETSISCGNNQYVNVAVRFMRTHNFAPGRYRFTIQGDDGVRFSIDGGATWILDSFIEQTFANSFRTTDTNFPNGICLSGNTNLVIEYFQRPAQARVKFDAITISPLFNTPQNQSVCEGQNASFDASSTQPGTTYQWQQSNDGGATWVNVTNTPPFSGATAGILNITNVTSALNGVLFRCVVDAGCGTPINSPTATLNVTSGGNAFSLQPLNANACVGDNASFTVVSGGILQWFFSIDGGTTFNPVVQGGVFGDPTQATLTLTGVTANMNGWLFYCESSSTCTLPVVTNSNTVTLNIGSNGAVIVTQPPPTLQACINANSDIIITVNNASAIQWQVSTDGGATFTDISGIPNFSGETTNTLNINPVLASMQGYVFRVKLPGCGSDVFSNNCTLTIVDSPQFIQQPALPPNICAGTNVTLTVNASNAQSYSWQVNTGGGFLPITNGANISGAGTSTINFTPIDPTWNGAQIQVVVGGSCPPSITSQVLNVTFGEAAQITTQPTPVEICAGENAVFSTGASGGNLSYQWQLSNDGGANFVNVVEGGQFSGSNSAVLLVSAVTPANDGLLFRCIADGGCPPPATSNSAMLTVSQNLPVIVQQPDAVTVCEGETANFSVSTANASSSFQWQIDAGQGFVNLVNNAFYQGVQTNQMSVISSVSLNGLNFRCVVTDCGGQVISNTCMITVLRKPFILTQPDSLSICENSAGNVSCQAAGEAITYQWQINNGSGWVDLTPSSLPFSGANSPNLIISFADISLDGTQIRCSITGLCTPSVITNAVGLTIKKRPEILTHPQDLVSCSSRNGIFEIRASGDDNIFRWYVRKSPTEPFTLIANSLDVLDSANYSRLTVKDITDEMNGYQYRAEVTGCQNTLLSNIAKLEVRDSDLNIYVPNSFSPNGDEINDNYKIIANDTYEVTGRIFNRWGEVIFSWDTANFSWDGTYNGKSVPEGIYIYYMEAKTECGKLEKKGSIRLIR